MRSLSIAAALVAAISLVPATQAAVQLRITCYSDGNECPITKELAARFTQQNPDIEIEIDGFPTAPSFKACRFSSPLATGPTSRG